MAQDARVRVTSMGLRLRHCDVWLTSWSYFLTLTLLLIQVVEGLGEFLIQRDDSGNVVTPSTVTSIGPDAFKECFYLQTVTVANGSTLSSIGSTAFLSSGLTTITVQSLF